MSVLDHPVITERYFFPRRAALADPWVVESNGVRLVGWRSATGTVRRTLLHFHGNGEIVADYLPDLANGYHAIGLDVAFAEYRGYGATTGVPRFTDLLDDALASYRALELPPDDVIVYGRSIGSLFAAHVVRHHPDVAGLVLESGIADPLERLLLRLQPDELGVSVDELALEIDRYLSPRAALERFGGSTLVLHARHDHMVGLHHARQLHAWAREPREIVIFPRGDHNSILAANLPSYFQTLLQWSLGL